MKISVIIPCYNEEEIIWDNYIILTKELDEINLPYEVIYCNDGSTDGSLEALSKIKNSDSRVQVISYYPNRGSGYAYQQLYKSCNGDIIFQMDADFSMDPSDTIPIFLKEIVNADVVVGSRYKGIKAAYPFERVIASKIYSAMNRLLFGIKIIDTQSGFIAFRRSILAEVNIESDGFEALLELFIKLSMRNGCKIKEVAVKFTHETLTGETDIVSEGIKMFVNTLRFWPKFITKKMRGEIWK